MGPAWYLGAKSSSESSSQENPRDHASVYSRLTFSWITPLMKYGYTNAIAEHDLCNIRQWDRAEESGDRFTRAWENQERNGRPSFWHVLARGFGWEYALSGLNELGADIMNLIQPALLQLLIQWVTSRTTSQPQSYAWGVSIGFILFTASCLQSLFTQQNFQLAFETGTHVRAALQVAMYRKSLKLSSQARGTKSVGDIVNLMSVDAQKFYVLARAGHALWSAPLQVVLAMILLYRLVGWSMLAGIAIMVIITPLNGVVAQLLSKYAKLQMDAKDHRIGIMTEIVENMKSIKLYAWSAAYLEKIRNVRNNEELSALRTKAAMEAFFNVMWSMPRYLVAGVTFGLYALMAEKPLTTDVIFPALALFNLLNFPLVAFAEGLSAVIDANVSARRLAEFLASEEMQYGAVTRKARDRDGDATAELVTIRDATFVPSMESDIILLQIDRFSGQAGQLTCVIGQVGSGKSSLLKALLGDLYKTRGQVTVTGNVAYVSQTPWIMNATVKENILFGQRYQPDLYQKTVAACALISDFQSLPAGDATEVGERGISLSGGQKARLSLARAVYSQADVYILDDCLSAVDEHVGKHLIQYVLGPEGMLRNTARILATNSTRVLKSANSIYFLRYGSVAAAGTLQQLMSQSESIASFISSHAEKREDAAPEDDQVAPSLDSPASDTSTLVEEHYDVLEPENDLGKSSGFMPEIVAAHKSTEVASRMSTDLLAKEILVGREDSDDEDAPLLSDIALDGGKEAGVEMEDLQGPRSATRKAEASEKGQVKMSVYLDYARACQPWAVIIWGGAMLGAQAMALGSGLWIKHWSDLNTTSGMNFEPAKYIGIYCAFGLFSAVLTGCEGLLCYSVCQINASRTLHDGIAVSLLRAPMSFFETTPAGQILNRFSSDISNVDTALAGSFTWAFAALSFVIFTLGLVCWTSPLFLILVIPLSLISARLQQYYVRTSREVSRLDSATKSPVFSHFQESLGGMASIRAFQRQQSFSKENEERIDGNLRAHLCYISSNRWVMLRLEFLGSFVVASAALLAVLAIAAGYKTSASAVGLVMSFALQITTTLSWFVRISVEVENNLVSVERIMEYTRLPSEAPEVLPFNRPTASWPAKGAVVFNNYSARYRSGLPLVLDTVNLAFKGGERIGIVGRTGAGKSTLTLALFRLIESANGHVDIDELDTGSIGLTDLRSRLSIIPQDATIMQGTIRHNLDPGGKYDDLQLWNALEHARLKDHISTMDGKLDAVLWEGGSNLSQGQRQLISLARALLSSSRVLVLDEATSAIDTTTDTLLQRTLRSDIFANRTIITIAHRINTVIDCDRIVVLEKGKVVEFGTPMELIMGGTGAGAAGGNGVGGSGAAEQGDRGLFRELVKEAGLLEGFMAGVGTAKQAVE